MGNRVGQVQWTILFNKCLLENIKYVMNAAVMNRVNKVSTATFFSIEFKTATLTCTKVAARTSGCETHEKHGFDFS